MRCSSCDDDGDYLACCIDGRLYDVCGHEHCDGCCDSAGVCMCNCHVDEPAGYGVFHLPEEVPPEVDEALDRASALLDNMFESMIKASEEPLDIGVWGHDWYAPRNKIEILWEEPIQVGRNVFASAKKCSLR